jgi:hypothetical protein
MHTAYKKSRMVVSMVVLKEADTNMVPKVGMGMVTVEDIA